MDVTLILDDMSSAVPSAWIVSNNIGEPVTYIPPLPANLIPEGTLYIDGFHHQPQQFITDLTIGTTYSVIMGANEITASIGEYIFTKSATFVATDTAILFIGIAVGALVTAGLIARS